MDPAGDRLAAAGTQQAAGGDRPRARPIGHLQDGGRFLAEMGLGGPLAQRGQFGALRGGQVEAKRTGHGDLLAEPVWSIARIIWANRINPGRAVRPVHINERRFLTAKEKDERRKVASRQEVLRLRSG
jgi:hypothetical protein